MSLTIIGNKVTNLPLTAAAGSQVTPTKAGSPAAVSPSVPVPPPAPLVINGVRIIIDVRSNSAATIVSLLNGIPGVMASIGPRSELVVSGINSIDGDSNLRTILGI